MILEINMMIIYSFSSTLSIAATSFFFFLENENLNINWYFLGYFMFYLLSFICFIIAIRVFKIKKIHEMHSFFFGLASMIEMAFFFILELREFEISSVTQQLAFLSRIVFLFLRFFMMYDMFIIDYNKIKILITIYGINQIIRFILYEENKNANNSISILFAFTSISLIFCDSDKIKKEEIYFEILKNMGKPFFVIQKNKNDQIICIEEELLKLPAKLKSAKKFNCLKNSDLNEVFIVQKKSLNSKNENLNEEILNSSEDDDYIKLNLEDLLKNYDKFRSSLKLQVKFVHDSRKSFVLTIKKVLIRMQEFFIFTLDQSNNSKKSGMELSYLIPKILKFRNTISDLLSTNEPTKCFQSPDQKNCQNLFFPNLKIYMSKIDNLLYYHLLGVNKFLFNPTRIPLLTFFKELSKTISPLSAIRRISFKISIDNSLSNYEIITEIQILNQIFLNLLSNSIESIVSGGFVHLKIMAMDDLNKVIKFVIEDSGVGFQKKQLRILNSILENKNFTDEKVIYNYFSLYMTNKLLKVLSPNQNLQVESLKNIGSSITFFFENFDQKSEFSNQIFQNLSHLNKEQIQEYKIEIKSPKHVSIECEYSLVRSAFSQKTSSFPSISEKSSECELNCDINTQTSTLPKLDTNIRFKTDTYFLIPEISSHSKRQEKKICQCKPIILVDFFDTSSFLKLKHYFIAKQLKYFLTTNETNAIERISRQKECNHANCKKNKIIFINCHSPVKETIKIIIEIKKYLEIISLDSIPIIGCIQKISSDEVDQCLRSGLTDIIPNSLLSTSEIERIFEKWTHLMNS